MLSNLIFGASTASAERAINDAEFERYCARWKERRMPTPTRRAELIKLLSEDIDYLCRPIHDTVDVSTLWALKEDLVHALDYIERHT